MPVGILLVTHEGVGTALRAVAQRLLGNLPLAVEVFELPWTAAPDDALPAASAALRRADGDAGVLVLTDLYGASPSNLAARLSRLGTPVRRAAGLNLSMLLRALNYPELDLDSLAATALAGCRNGAIADDA